MDANGGPWKSWISLYKSWLCIQIKKPILPNDVWDRSNTTLDYKNYNNDTFYANGDLGLRYIQCLTDYCFEIRSYENQIFGFIPTVYTAG